MNPTRVALGPSLEEGAIGVVVNDPVLPPVIGAYLTPDEVHALFKIPGRKPIKIDNIFHTNFINVERMEMGDDEVEIFNSTVMGQAHAIPEPSTVFGLGLTVGLGALLKNQHSIKRDKKDLS